MSTSLPEQLVLSDYRAAGAAVNAIKRAGFFLDRRKVYRQKLSKLPRWKARHDLFLAARSRMLRAFEAKFKEAAEGKTLQKRCNVSYRLVQASMRKKLIECLATGFDLGKAPLMPGTFGTLLGPPLAWVLMQGGGPFFLIATIVAILLAVAIAELYEVQSQAHDPGAS